MPERQASGRGPAQVRQCIACGNEKFELGKRGGEHRKFAPQLRKGFKLIEGPVRESGDIVNEGE
jgi:hypothetical protein